MNKVETLTRNGIWLLRFYFLWSPCPEEGLLLDFVPSVACTDLGDRVFRKFY